MFKAIVILCAVTLSVVLAKPVTQEEYRNAQLLSYNNEITDDGYRYSYETSDGQTRAEYGQLRDGTDENGQPTKVIYMEGAYSYVAPDGETYWVTYTADENGYHPKTGKGVGIDPNVLKSLLG